VGDRTYATCTIKEYHYEQLVNEFNGKDKLLEIIGCDDVQLDGGLATFIAQEANYGYIDELTKMLVEKEIEYDHHWESGGDYEAGTIYTRKIKDVYCSHEICDTYATVCTELKNIFKEKDPKVIKNLLKEKIKELEPFEATPLDQPQSVDFIKNF